MINFKELSNKELAQINKSLNYFGGLIFDTLIKSNIFLINTKIKKEIFLIPKNNYEIFLKFKNYRVPYYLGIYFGDLKNESLFFSLNSLQVINNLTTKKIMVNKQGELKFIYGKNLQKKHIIKIFSNFNPLDKMIIINNKNEVLGLGKTIYPINIKFNNNIKIKNIIDIGWYLRKGN
ncbi:MAG: NIP7 pre-PUA domain-containing protein [Candidatus Helarchaeota archaeon]